MFIDESGHDRRASPYEVLAGLAVEDHRTWDLICAIHAAEAAVFGTRISLRDRELKGKHLLKRKTFRLAAQGAAIEPTQRTRLARECLVGGRRRARGEPFTPTRDHLTALGQAKLAFVAQVFELCERHGAHTFASIIDPSVPRPDHDGLRQDYARLFEHYATFLGEQAGLPQGLIIFDELERSRSHILIEQMDEYFRGSAAGRERAERVLPEPLFVHSDLSTLVQIADLVAYIISWGVRGPGLSRPARAELGQFADAVYRLRHRSRSAATPLGSFSIIEAL